MTTTVTVELDEGQVDYLRAHFRYSDAPQLSCCASDMAAVVATVAAALPPEPVTLAIVVPPGLAAKLRNTGQHRVVPLDPSVDLWRLAEAALAQQEADR